MILRLLKALKDSIDSLSGVTQWDDVAKDLIKQEITGYDTRVRNQPTTKCPKYSVANS